MKGFLKFLGLAKASEVDALVAANTALRDQNQLLTAESAQLENRLAQATDQSYDLLRRLDDLHYKDAGIIESIATHLCVYLNCRRIELVAQGSSMSSNIWLLEAFKNFIDLPDDGMPGHCLEDFDWEAGTVDLPISREGSGRLGYCRLVLGTNDDGQEILNLYCISMYGALLPNTFLTFHVWKDDDRVRKGQYFRDYEITTHDYVVDALNAGTPVPTTLEGTLAF